MVTGVEDAGSDGSLVAFTDEARHIRLYHHVLLGHGLAIEHTVAHILRVGQPHEAPGSETLRQRELQGYRTLCIRRQLGIEEGGLVEVLAHLHLHLLLGFCSEI